MFLTTPLRSCPTLQLGKQAIAIFLALFFDQRSTADHDVAPRFVDLQHFALDRPADVVTDVGRTTDVDLAGRQEDVDTDVDQQTALDLARDRAGDDLALLDRLHHLLPGDDLSRPCAC